MRDKKIEVYETRYLRTDGLIKSQKVSKAAEYFDGKLFADNILWGVSGHVLSANKSTSLGTIYLEAYEYSREGSSKEYKEYGGTVNINIGSRIYYEHVIVTNPTGLQLGRYLNNFLQRVYLHIEGDDSDVVNAESKKMIKPKAKSEDSLLKTLEKITQANADVAKVNAELKMQLMQLLQPNNNGRIQKADSKCKEFEEELIEVKRTLSRYRDEHKKVYAAAVLLKYRLFSWRHFFGLKSGFWNPCSTVIFVTNENLHRDFNTKVYCSEVTDDAYIVNASELKEPLLKYAKEKTKSDNHIKYGRSLKHLWFGHNVGLLPHYIHDNKKGE